MKNVKNNQQRYDFYLKKTSGEKKTLIVLLLHFKNIKLHYTNFIRNTIIITY